MAAQDANHHFVNLSELEEHPKSWLQVRNREVELKRSYLVNELRALLEYHAYGFQCKKIFRIKQKYIDLLHKILYCTQKGLGNNVAFTDQRVVRAGPVGPGTLPYHIRNARGLPSWHLTRQAALQTIRPHQSLCSPQAYRPGAEVPCYKVTRRTRTYSYSNAQQSSSRADAGPSQSAVVIRTPTRTATTPQLSAPKNDVVVSGDGNGDGRDAPAAAAAGTASTKLHRNDVNSRIFQKTAQCIWKAIVASAYSGLQVVSNAFLHAEPFLLATKSEDLIEKLTENRITSSHVSIRLTENADYTIDQDGAPLPYYGRGAEWHDDSSDWDCIIVSSLFLNAGYTYADRGTQVKQSSMRKSIISPPPSTSILPAEVNRRQENAETSTVGIRERLQAVSMIWCQLDNRLNSLSSEPIVRAMVQQMQMMCPLTTDA